MKRSASLTAILAIVVLHACAARNTPVTVAALAEGCPAILLTRTGGLGFESQSGIIAAVWPSGQIVRAESAAQPWQRHIVGRLAPADVASLMELVQSADGGDDVPGNAGLDMPDDTLMLRRGNEVRQWAETPGFTSTAVVADFRSRVFSLSIERATAATGPLDELWTCVTARQRETR